jgi:hypothetical protein
MATVSARALIGASLLSFTHKGQKPHFAMTSCRPFALATMIGTARAGDTL